MPRSAPLPAALPRPAFRWVAVFCAGVVWLLGLLAGSPQLHASLHKDAGLTDHACAATLFSQGAENPAPQVVFITAPQAVVVAAVVPDEPLRAELPEAWLRPGRGPPVR